MSRELSNSLGTIALIALAILALAEMGLTTTWNKLYFMFGLPIFVKKIPVKNHRAEIPPKHIFETRFRSNGSTPIVFGEIGANGYGFCEEMLRFSKFGLRYTPVMHGWLVFDDANHQVVVKGFANWYILGFSLLWFGMLTSGLFNSLSTAIPFGLFFIVIVGVIYAIQYSRFSKVAAVAAQAWQHH